MKYSFFPQDGCTSLEYDILMRHDLKSAALFYLDRNATLTERAAMVLYEAYRDLPPMAAENGLPAQTIMPPATNFCVSWYKPKEYDPKVLDPWIAGDRGRELGLYVSYCGQLVCDWEVFEKEVVSQYPENSVEWLFFQDVRDDANVQIDPTPSRYYHPGMHRVADNEALMDRGYLGLIEDLEAEMANADEEKQSFLRGLIYTAYASMEYLQRCAAHYQALAQDGDPLMVRLAESMSRVPANPCESFFDAALVSRLLTILVYGEHGRIDQVLYPLYKKDLDAGRITREEASFIMDDLFRFINAVAEGTKDIMWHSVIGGCDKQGNPAYNDLTRIIIENIGKYAQPHISLRVNSHMPEDIWNLVLEKLSKGSANPALINEDVFINDLVNSYDIPIEDARDFAFGGCSETLIPGCTCVDSTWVAFNTLDILNTCIYRNLTRVSSFDEFFARFKADLTRTVREMKSHIDFRQHAVGAFIPEPFITLHTRGCKESGRSFYNGGAIYNFDSANIYGLTNAINSLYSIKACFEGKIGCTPQELLDALKDNFQHAPQLLSTLRKLPKFGNGDWEVGDLAHETANHLFDAIRSQRCYRGNGRFMPCIAVLYHYIKYGEKLGASPDGRLMGEPLCDSCGPSAGTDREGPTAMMADAARLPHEKGAGTFVLNLMLAPNCFASEEKLNKVKALFRGYFAMSGTQVQTTVVDRQTLLDAFEHPENHRNLIVRVGGFSDYFSHLNRDVQKTILKRSGYEVI